jgi:hypothetical protein
VPSNDWCSHQMWEVVWWLTYMARWAYIFVGTIHALYKLFHFNLMCGQVGTNEISLKLMPLSSKFQENHFCVVWETRPDRCDLLIYWYLFRGYFRYLCVILHQVSQGQPKFYPAPHYWTKWSDICVAAFTHLYNEVF